jgi:hypothetical protein
VKVLKKAVLNKKPPSLPKNGNFLPIRGRLTLYKPLFFLIVSCAGWYYEGIGF